MILLIALASFLNINSDEQDLPGSLTEAIHRELLRAIPGICRDEFALDDSTNDLLGDRITVHGIGDKHEFCIRVWHEMRNGCVRILDIEAKDENELSKLIQCKSSASFPFRK